MFVPLVLASSLPAHVSSPFDRPRFLHEYTLPLGAYPASIVSGPDGALWFDTYPYFSNHQAIDLGIGRIALDGSYQFFLIGNGTYDLVLGADGRLWFTNPYLQPYNVGALATDGTLQFYGNPSVGEPEWITRDAAGALWYTAFGGNPGIVEIDTSGNTLATYDTQNQLVTKIAAGRRNTVWFDEAARLSLVGRIGHAGLREHQIGGPAYIPGPMVLGPDGRMWLSDCTYVAAIGDRFDVTLYPMPYDNSCIDGITSGPDGRLWAADFERGELARIATDGSVFEYPVPSPEMMPYGITVGPDRNIWYTEIQRQTDVSKIGVLKP